MAEKKKTERKNLRAMPNNVEAEQNVLGALLIDDKMADVIMPTLAEEDFFVSQNRIIYAAMRELVERSSPIDTVSVADKLELQGKLDEVGSIDYLNSLAMGVVSSANAKYYADIIKRDSLTRKVISAGNDILEYAYTCEDGADALGKAEQLVFKIAEEKTDKALTHAKEALATAFQNIQDAQAGNTPSNLIFTGFTNLDRKTKGLKPGDFVILAARPGVGKTALALNIAVNCLLKNKTVAVFNMEMTAPALVKRMLAYLSGVTFESMDVRGQLSDSDIAKLYNAYTTLLGKELYIDDYSMNHPSDILSKCRRLKREKGLDLVIVDYLQLMEADSKGRASESRQNDVSTMSRQLKVYAKELGVPILALSQMSRGAEKEGRAPQLSDLRDSGAIEQDADVVMFLHDPSKVDENLPKDEILLLLRKNRSGSIGEMKLHWDGNTTTFRDIDESGAVREPETPVIQGDVTRLEEVETNGNPMPFQELAGDFEEVVTAEVLPFDDDDMEYVDEGDELPF
ncbi:MAG: replicative DNA helicase [Clostridia bacterium]|nr:replicative DNA helicase [Clostridia bacterium]